MADPPWKHAVVVELHDIAAPSVNTVIGKLVVIMRIAIIRHRVKHEDHPLAVRPGLSRMLMRTMVRQLCLPVSQRGSDVAAQEIISVID